MNTLDYIVKKYNIDLKQKSPFYINCGRWQELPKLLKELDFKIGAEIGVLRGWWSENLFSYIPDLKLYGIDKWKCYPTYRDFKSQKQLDEYHKEAKKKLKKFDCKLIKKWSMDAVKDFDDESLDFVFIDGNHSFEYVTNDIAEWSKKVKKGGIVAGHDFYRSRSRILIHVKDVVPAWAYAHSIHPWFVLCGNKGKSWMWVKE